MKKSIFLVASFAISIYALVSSCNKSPVNSAPNPNAPPLGTVTTLAGPSFPVALGSPLSASFRLPYGVAVDDFGNVYVADYGNNLIRKISPLGIVSTLAGTGASGHTDGPAATATFGSPIGVAIDKSENIYVADYGNGLIRMISPAGVVSTLAGNGVNGSTNGAGTTASFFGPTGVAVDQSGNVYVADQLNQMIRMISTSGVVSTLAGTGAKGSANGPGAAATFHNPTGVAVDKSGNVYVADEENNQIRKIDPAGNVSTLAGTGAAGSTNGPGGSASFSGPFGVTADTLGNVFVGDQTNDMIRIINSSGVVSTLAGSGASGAQNGTGLSASFNLPSGVAVDAAGNVYVADFDNYLIREISPSGTVSTLAGSGQAGSANPSTTASFLGPTSTAVDAQGNVYVVDQGNNVIRMINSSGMVSTLAGNGNSASIDGPASSASFAVPSGIAVDLKGNIYVSEIDNKIRMISPSGIVSTLAGSGALGSTNGIGSAASFSLPAGLAVDNTGNVLVADAGNNLIRVINSSGQVSTLAGNGMPGFTNGSYPYVSFNSPIGVAVDGDGNVYVADAGNNAIRMITPAGFTTTLAGNGTAGSLDGMGASATFDNPGGIAADPGGTLYVTDFSGNRIRQVDPNGAVWTLAGNGLAGSANGVGTAATFNRPAGIAVDKHSIMYVADERNNLIRMVVQLP